MDRSSAGRLGWLASQPKQAALRQKRRAAAIAKFADAVCANCQQPLSFKKRRNTYCGWACAAAANNRQRKAPSLAPACLVCGIPTRRKESKFCSARHAQQARYAAYIAKWLSGEGHGGSWRGVSPHVRRWLRETRGDHCAKCGWSEIHPNTGKVPVQVNHIDGDPNNHQAGNLELLCPNCHSLTPTFGALNRGRGRAQRYLRTALP